MPSAGSSSPSLAEAALRGLDPEEVAKLFVKSLGPKSRDRAREWAMRGTEQPAADWGERYFYIEDPCDTATGAPLTPGPIRLFPIQKALLKAALEVTPDLGYRWQTIVWSATKKCLNPETRTLTADLRWVELGDLEVGDELLAFDENPLAPPGRGNKVPGGTGRRYRIAEVLDTGLVPMLARRLYLEDGTVLVASHDHKWLTRVRGGENLKWRKTANLRVGDTLSKYLPVWSEPHGYDDGYVAGCLDGEGSVRPDCREIGLGQKDNELLAEFKRIIAAHGIEMGEYVQHTYSGPYKGHSIRKLVIKGGRPWSLYTLGHFRPKRLLGRVLPVVDGGIGQIWRIGDVRIEAIEEEVAELVTLQTSTETYFAEGFAAHNSGKSRLAAMVDSWVADQMGPYAEVYLAANDGKQSGDRLLNCIKRSIELNQKLGTKRAMARWQSRQTSVSLPNGSVIEAIPVDPTGQAGANPACVTLSELWGYRLEHKQRLWAALTLSPTKRGMSFRWADTYAGYEGESPTLEDLYDKTVKRGRHYVDWADENRVGYDPLLRELELPLFVNEAGRIWCYWETEPRYPWQSPEYYEEQAATLPEMEFRRIHKNEWVTSEDVFVPIEWWHACQQADKPFPPLGRGEYVVLGVDAAVSGDSFAVVGVTRHPLAFDTHVAVRYCRVWYPPKGGELDFEPIDQEIRAFCAEHDVVEVAYDRWQLHKMASDQRRDQVAHWRPFGQQAERLEADAQLYQLIRAGQIVHDGTHGELTRHVANANSKMSKEEETKLRIVKSQRGKIDACVALSMAAHRCLYLNL